MIRSLTVAGERRAGRTSAACGVAVVRLAAVPGEAALWLSGIPMMSRDVVIDMLGPLQVLDTEYRPTGPSANFKNGSRIEFATPGQALSRRGAGYSLVVADDTILAPELVAALHAGTAGDLWIITTELAA